MCEVRHKDLHSSVFVPDRLHCCMASGRQRYV